MCALKGFLPYCYDRGDSAIRLVEAAATALTAPKPPAGKWAHGDTDTDWYDLLGLLPAAMYLAAAPLTTPEHRAALLALLETYAGSGLAAPGGRLRKLTLEPTKKVRLKAGSVLQVERRRLLVTSWYDDSGAALEYAPDGQFGPIPDFTITEEEPMALPTEVSPLVRLVRENGPPQWRSELAAECSQAAGVSHAEAVLLLAGLPAEVSADTLGLSSYLLRAAREAWQGSGRPGELLSLLLPDDPAGLWTDGPRLDRLAAWRVERHGRRAPVPDELLETVHRAGVAEPMPASELLHGIANPDTCRWLNAGDTDITEDADITAETVAVAVARALPWLAYHLPLDHPIRASLPVVAERARQRLLHPGVCIDVGYLDEKKVDRLITALGGNPVTGPEWIQVVPVEIEATDDWRTVRVRPALLSGPDDPALAVVQTRLEDTEDQALAALRLLLAGRLAETVAVPPVPAELAPADGQFLHDPSRCVPDLVAEVAGKLGLSVDFLARLPALRGGFNVLSPAARGRLLEVVHERLGGGYDVGAVDDPDLLLARLLADRAGLDALSRHGLSLPSTLDDHPPTVDLAAQPVSGQLSAADRWRLVLGRESRCLNGPARRYATALDELYGTGQGEGCRDGDGAGREPTFPSVREWAQELEELSAPGYARRCSPAPPSPAGPMPRCCSIRTRRGPRSSCSRPCSPWPVGCPRRRSPGCGRWSRASSRS